MKRLFILLLVVFFAFSLGLKQALAKEETAASLVAKFEKAKLIKPGEHKGDSVKKEEAEYYKMEILPGYQVQILYLSASSEFDDAFLEYTLFDEKGEKLSFARSLVSKETKMGIFNLPSTSQDFLSSKAQARFLEIKASQKDIDSHVFEFKKVDKTDAGSGADAGNDFDTAQEIKPGDYPENFLARNECGEKYCSTDEKDMYKVAVEKGEKLTVKITPNPYLQPKIEFYNELKEKQKGEATAVDKGTAVEIFYISDGDQNVYFSVEDVNLKDYFGSYSMNVSVKTATTKELEEGEMIEEEVVKEEVPLFPEEEATIPEEEAPLITPKEEIPPTVGPEAVAEFPEVAETFISKLKGMLIWLIVGFIIFIGIIIAVVVLILKARKKPPQSPLAPPKPPIPPAPPKTLPTEEAPPESPAEPIGPNPPKPSEEGTSGMILPPKELRGK